MKNVIQIINQIGATTKTIEKANILKQNENNELLKKVLYYTYADNLNYGFSEKKLREILEAPVIKTYDIIWNNGFDMLDILATSNINDTLRLNVKTFLLAQEDDIRELYIKILTKDLRCNISSKSINKVFKKLIPVWDVQQGYPINKVKLKKNEWIALSLKLNGIRASYFKDNFKSRQNKDMLGFAHIIEDLKQVIDLDKYFVDGEMIRKNIDNISDNENFRLTTSIINSDSPEKIECEYVIFDLVPIEEFIKGESKLTFKNRLQQMKELQNQIDTLELKNIRVAPTYYTGTDHSEIDKILNKVDSEGYEGLMCIRDMPYKTKRHNGMLKCKVFKSCDIPIIGFEEGDGKYVGTLGSIIARYKDNNTVNIGSGFTDEQRKDIWLYKDELVNRIVQVKYKEESKDKTTGLLSLQFPIFECIREEGKEESYN